MSLLRGENLSLTLGGHPILQGIDIALQPGELLGLIGPNGAGKSSLLKLLAGLVTPTQGSLRLGDRPYPEISPTERARRLAWLPQQGQVHWPLSVETLVEFGRTPHLSPWEQPNESDREIIERILQQTDLLSLRQRAFDTLSGGEQARALLARALATEPEILLADEPVAALDLAHQLDVMELLGNYCQQDRGVIVVLHDLALAAHFCRRLILLHHGSILAAGHPSQVLSDANLAKAYQIRPKGLGTNLSFAIPWERITDSGLPTLSGNLAAIEHDSDS